MCSTQVPFGAINVGAGAAPAVSPMPFHSLAAVAGSLFGGAGNASCRVALQAMAHNRVKGKSD
jgi:hypothetical protein